MKYNMKQITGVWNLNTLFISWKVKKGNIVNTS